MPPEGHARWTLRLLAGKVVELGFVPSISHETVRSMLWQRRRNAAHAGIKWRFTTAAARTTLHQLYPAHQQHVD